MQRSMTIPPGAKIVTIDSDTYEVFRFVTTKGLQVLTRLANIIGHPLHAMLDGYEGPSAKIGKNTKDGKTNLEDRLFPFIGMVIKELSERLDEEIVLGLVTDLVSTVRIAGREINFDIHFQGRYLHLFRLCGEVLMVNYEDFLKGLSEKLKTVVRKVQDTAVENPMSQEMHAGVSGGLS